MFERYTESARRALFFARAEVATLGGSAIETDHLLLGLLRAARDVTWRLCVQAGVTCERARAQAERRTASAHRDPAIEQLATLTGKSPEAVVLLQEIQLELDELQKS